MNPRPTYGTWTILGIYVIVFVHFHLMDPTLARLLAAGAAQPARIACGEPWRLLSAAFVHIGLLHIAFNGYFLWAVGPIVETSLGTTKFLILYIVAGIGGNTIAVLLYHPQLLTAGGSTSLFGFLGALAAILIRRRRSFADLASDAALRQIGGLIAINLMIGLFVPQISNTGHIGGLLSGFGLVMLGYELPALGGHARHIAIGPAVAGAALFVAVTLLAIFPIHRDWYLLRAWWRAEPVRAAQLEPALVKRLPRSKLDFVVRLARLKVAREGKPANPDAVDWFRWQRENSDPSAFAYAHFGFWIDRLAPFLAAEKRGDANPGQFLPDDPWRH